MEMRPLVRTLLLPLLSFLLLATPSQGQFRVDRTTQAKQAAKEQPQPPDLTDPKPLTQTQLDRLYCLPGVIASMKTIWLATDDGMGSWEAAFIVSHVGNVYIEPMERGRPRAQTVFIFGNTVALFHVHPNDCDSEVCIWPSTPDDNYEHNGMGDTGLADKYKIDIYVLTNRALTRYRPGVGNEKLRDGLDWSKQCEEGK